MPRKIHVVINPASGQPQPIFHTLNRVFRSSQSGLEHIHHSAKR